ncbi:uncharacterized protein MAM_02562 [Metarhizium album ARSEF 1941]|uniref:Uncharacterized protein n=1 Tax=Metarhizium album (strain ARSEF 1941) TaxID=1081103 RepID=A0A0B2X1I2_METAS|nr:uncharacterized protein MAM_02562 [Metarhizium album ARSEF 1941]KHN99709.1 hypothetical protein MAM_02562 [Metarhizium album ARSEF 1941]
MTAPATPASRTCRIPTPADAEEEVVVVAPVGVSPDVVVVPGGVVVVSEAEPELDEVSAPVSPLLVVLVVFGQPGAPSVPVVVFSPEVSDVDVAVVECEAAHAQRASPTRIPSGISVALHAARAQPAAID